MNLRKELKTITSVINDKQNYLIEETNKKNNASDLSMCYSDFSQRSNLSITTKFH